MPRDTSAGGDAQVWFSIPVCPDPTQNPTARAYHPAGCGCDACANPWGTRPDRIDPQQRLPVVEGLLEGIEPLLDLAQQSHRKGTLSALDQDQLQALQRWFSCLRQEKDSLEAQPPPPTPSPGRRAR